MISTAKVLYFLSKGRRIRLVLITQKYSSCEFLCISFFTAEFLIIKWNSWPILASVWSLWSRVIVPSCAQFHFTFLSTLGHDQVMNSRAGEFFFNPVLFASHIMVTVRKYMFSHTQKVSNIFSNQHSLSLTISCCEFNHLEWT